MPLVIEGRVVPLTERGDASFPGRVYVGDDGRLAGTRRRGARPPAGFAGAPVVETGGAVYPGLIDLHSHTAYNTLPLWTEPGRTEPWLNHNAWTGARSYHRDVVWPAGILGYAAGPALLAYIGLKALVGGTTAIQGSVTKPKLTTPYLVRVVENDQPGARPDPVRASTLAVLDAAKLTPYVEAMKTGVGFIYHCAEGRPGSVVTREYDVLAQAAGLRPELIAVHCCALDAAAFARWRRPGTVVWSPFSNLWLYGTTTPVEAARAAGLRIALGSDWSPSGTKHVLGELKVADLHNRRALGGRLGDRDLVEMVTANPGDALTGPWQVPVGRLVPGGLADVLVVTDRDADPWRNLITAVEGDVELVLVGGRARYGTPELMAAAGAAPVQRLTIAGQSRAASIPRFDDPAKSWSLEEIRAELNAVRADPGQAVADTRDRAAAWDAARTAAAATGALPPPPPLIVVPDLATADTAAAGLPADPASVTIPPLDRLWHDRAFFARVEANPAHGSQLSGLRDYYPDAAR